MFGDHEDKYCKGVFVLTGDTWYGEIRWVLGFSVPELLTE